MDKSGSSDDDYHGGMLAEDVLSSETFNALLEFQQMGGFFKTGENDSLSRMKQEEDSLEATLRRLQRQEADAISIHEKTLELKYGVRDLVACSETNIVETLRVQGVIRIDNVLTPELCDLCLARINLEFAASSIHAAKTCDSSNTVGFGNIFSRKNRYDMYLRDDGVYESALHDVLAKDCVLGDLFDTLLEGRTGAFHELSSLISDPTSACQAVHPDSTFTEHVPLWTVFIALQDVQADMGPTVFLPCTNTLACHEKQRNNHSEEKNVMLESSEYRRGVLKKGDCAVMDSRTLHFGDANDSEQRRVLLYFTIRNPKVDEYPMGGSLFSDLHHMTTQDYYD